MQITEEQMFRVVVVVGVAMIPVIALAALVSPAVGAGLFFVEAAAGAWWLVKRWRAVRPFSARQKAEVPPEVDSKPQAGSHDA